MSPSRGVFKIDHNASSPLLRLSSLPAVRAALGFLAVFLLCCLYGRANFYRDPGSIFFDQDRASIRKYSAYRQHQAETFIDSVAQHTWDRRRIRNLPGFQKASENASMCAVFLTVTRDADKQYLEASLGSALEGLTVAERADINLQVFFANTNPSQHPTWYRPWLRPLVDYVYTYADLYSFEGMADVVVLDKAGVQATVKPPLDYALALQQCIQTTQARYITVIEDDVIAAEGWFARALWAAKEVDWQTWEQGRFGKWMHVRLFNDEGSTGWKSSRIGANNEAPISLAAAIVAYLILLLVRTCLRSASPSAKSHLDKWTMLVICCVAVPSFVVLFFQCGKSSILPPPPGVREERLGCCNQALVFNREHVPGLVQHLHQSSAIGRHDVLTREYGVQLGLAEFSLYPAMVQHVGTQPSFQTIIANESSNARSMTFESMNPRHLRRDHAKFVNRLYGVDAIS